MRQSVSRQTVGIPGIVGVALLAVWAVGFLVLGVHGRGWHVLVPVGALLLLAQVVRRLHVTPDDD